MKIRKTTKTSTEATAEAKETSCLQVTSCNVYLLKEPHGKTKALARVVLNDQLQLTGLRVMQGCNSMFVSYPCDPSYKGDDFRSLFYPITKPLRDHIEQTVLKAYEDAIKDQ